MSDLAAKMGRQARKKPAARSTGVSPAVEEAESWEDLNKRATFHLPVALLDRLQNMADQTGRTKSALVRQSIEEMLSNT